MTKCVFAWALGVGRVRESNLGQGGGLPVQRKDGCDYSFGKGVQLRMHSVTY